MLMKQLIYLLLFLAPTVGLSQIKSGQVRGKDNLPLADITVSVKGTSIQTKTDVNGLFEIKPAISDATLIFNGIGYETYTIKPADSKPIYIVLKQKISSLDEVQVIGYGTTTQRYNVGSVTKIRAADIESQAITNPLAALQGRVPGLVVNATSGLPGSSFNIQIRGQNSIAPKVNGLGILPPMDKPLFIVDGVPYATQNENINQLNSIQSPNTTQVYNNQTGGISPFNSINPSDIESIEILRDADATAIYGSRGANGVILITTKRGNSGKTSFVANFNQGASVTGKTMRMMNTAEYLEMRKEALKNEGLEPNLTLFDIAYAPDLLVFDQNKYTDWKDYFLGNTAKNTVANLTLSGGTINTNFRISGGYNRNTYLFPGDYSDNRASFSSNLQHSSANKKFSINLSTNYSYNKNNSSGSPDLLIAYRLEPNFPDLLDQNNNIVWEYSGVDLGLGIGDNPVSYLKNSYYNKNTMLNTGLNLAYQLNKDMSIRTNIGYNSFLNKEYYGNPFAAQNPKLSPEATASFGSNDNSTWIVEPQLDYKKKIYKGLLTIMIGGTIQQKINSKSMITGQGYTNDDLIESINTAPNRWATDGNSEYKYTALFGRINYTLEDKYIVNINARRDGSSRFGPNRKFGNFGSVGTGWLFSQEGFIKRALPVVSYGKLRTSYGLTGNDAIGDYQFISRWGTTTLPYENTIGYQPLNLFNPTLSWGATKKLEAGLELGFLKDRLLFNGAWYRNLSRKQLVSYYLPAQTGFSSVFENWDAVVQNSGLEISLQSQNIRNNHFKWNTAFNISFPSNKLVSFPGLESSSYATRYQIGKSINTVYGFNYAGVNPETGIFQFKTQSGELTSAPSGPSGTNFNDYSAISTRDPKYYGGLANSFTYKNWQLNLFFEFKKQQGTNYLQQVYAYPPGWEYNVPATLLNRWQQPGDISDFQKFTSSVDEVYRASVIFSQSSGIYSDASYIRFKTANLSYSITNDLAKRIGLSGARVYIAAQNLFTMTNYLGNDPETQSIYAVPVLKTFVFGLSLTL